MKKLIPAILLLGTFATTASAQPESTCRTFDRARGECSINTQAPSLAALQSAIEHGTSQRLMGTLEYGQMVECYDCVPLLMRRVLSDDNARVREFGAWWLRQRPFAANWRLPSSSRRYSPMPTPCAARGQPRRSVSSSPQLRSRRSRRPLRVTPTPAFARRRCAESVA